MPHPREWASDDKFPLNIGWALFLQLHERGASQGEYMAARTYLLVI